MHNGPGPLAITFALLSELVPIPFPKGVSVHAVPIVAIVERGSPIGGSETTGSPGVGRIFDHSPCPIDTTGRNAVVFHMHSGI